MLVVQPKFDLGQVVATPEAMRVLEESGQTPAFFLDQHIQGSWGEVCDEDKGLNDQALVDGSRLLSAYRTLKGERIWIITEAVGDDGKRSVHDTSPSLRSIEELLTAERGEQLCRGYRASAARSSIPTTGDGTSGNRCGFRICPMCLDRHEGKYGRGGFKCSHCQFGWMEEAKGQGR